MELLPDSFEHLEVLQAKGANGIQYLDKEKGVLLKRFKSYAQLEEREKMLDYLLLFSPIKGSGYPKEILSINGETEGYVSTYFENSTPFNKTNHFCFSEKIKAMKDVTFQLQEVHKRGIIFHDMNSANQLINQNGGHLVDFEDTYIPTRRYPASVKYFLYYKKKYLKTSMKQDQIKQYISNIGLLYDIDLESYFYKRGSLEELPQLVKEEPSLAAFLQENIEKLEDESIDTLDYFTDWKEDLNDEQKQAYYRQKLQENTILKPLILKK